MYDHQQQCPQIPAMDSDGTWRDSPPQATSHPHVAPNCPRCASTNTKFCYYNNYSLTQPRYFCKACRRYWTKGGSLRNVPVGGGCRKTRRSRSKSHRQNNPHPHPTSNGDSPHDNNSSSSTSSGHSGPDIDMAAVFARYVSQGDVAAAAEPKKVGDGDNQVSTWREEDDLDSFDFEMVVTDDFYWSSMAPLTQMDASPSVDELLDSDASWSACFDVAGCGGDFYRP